MRILTLILLIGAVIQEAKADTIPLWSYELNVGSRYDMGDDLKNVEGNYGIEAGVNIRKKSRTRTEWIFAPKLSLSKYRSDSTGRLLRNDVFLDTTYITRKGILENAELNLLVPILFGYQPFSHVKLKLLVGTTLGVNLINNMTIEYIEEQWNRETGELIRKNESVEKELERSFFESELINAGIEFKVNSFGIQLMFSGGSVSIDDNFLGGYDKLSFMLNMNYAL